MIVVKVGKSSSEEYKSCVKFIAKKGKECLGDDFKIISNNRGFQVYGGKSKTEENDISAELIIKKTINLKENNVEDFYKKLEFFFNNANKIMEKFTDGD